MTNLLLETPLTLDQQQKAGNIKRSAESLLAVINDILDFSKIEAGKLDLEAIDFDLEELLSDVFLSMDVRAKEKGILLIKPVPLSHHWYHSDPVRIRQILNNLLSNALKFTHQGSITLLVEMRKDEQQNQILYCEITDTGIGLSEAHENSIFHRFTQADTSITRKFGGTGLGLSICKQLAELLGGDIGVNSTLNKGSTFWFQVPLVSVAEKTDVVSQQIGRFDAEILLVEDDEMNQMVVQGMLGQLGIEPDIADNGEQAIKMLAEKDYDLVFMDCQMPIMDGYTATKTIRDFDSAVKNHEIPIVAMTAHSMQTDRVKCLDVGMNDFLSKPLELKKIATALQQWLPTSCCPTLG